MALLFNGLVEHRGSLPFVDRTNLARRMQGIGVQAGNDWFLPRDRVGFGEPRPHFGLVLQYSGSTSGASAILLEDPELAYRRDPYDYRNARFFAALYQSAGHVRKPFSGPYTHRFVMAGYSTRLDVPEFAERLTGKRLEIRDSFFTEKIPFEIALGDEGGSPATGVLEVEYHSNYGNPWEKSKLDVTISRDSGQALLSALTAFLWVLFPEFSQRALTEEHWTIEKMPRLLSVLGHMNFSASDQVFETDEGFLWRHLELPFWLRLPKIEGFMTGNGHNRPMQSLGDRRFRLYHAKQTGRVGEPAIVGLWI